MKKIIVLSFLLFITISKFTLSEKSEELYNSKKYLEVKKIFEKITEKNHQNQVKHIII